MRHLLLALLLLLPMATAALAADPPEVAAGTSAITAAQARQALDTLKDPAKRDAFIATLETIAKGTAAPEPATVLPLAPDSVGAQLLMDASTRLSTLADDLLTTLRTVTDFPLLWRFAVQLVNDPWSQGMLIATGWRLIVVAAVGLAAQWLVRRLLHHPAARFARRARAARTAENDADIVKAIAAAEAGQTEELPPRRPFAPLAILRRLPAALGRLAFDLVPILALLATTYALLGLGLGDDAIARLVILALMNAYALCRVATSLLRAIAGPGEPRLLPTTDALAHYLLLWLRRIAAVGIFGYTIAEAGLLFGLYRIAHDALLKLVVLVIYLMLAAVVLQNRAPIAALLRAPDGKAGAFALVRNRLANVWHLAAVFYLLALWAVWALDVPNGFSRLLRLVVLSAIVLSFARLVITQLHQRLGAMANLSPDLIERYPGLDTRIGTYHPIARALLTITVWTLAAVALLEAWGFDAFAWFSAARLGGRLLSALASIGTTLALALLVWELINTAIQRHLSRLAREAQLARSARLRTLLPMVRTALLITILLVAGLMVLSDIGVNIAPLLAGAGVVGIAIGFGSQKLVQDIITGLFLLLENAMQVGDAVTLGGLSGSVEALSVRTIRLRALDGSVHLIPFSAVTTVTNLTRDFGFAVFEIQLSLNEDPDRITELVREIANDMRKDEKWAPIIKEDVEIFGLDKFVTGAFVLQGRIKTTATGRWSVRRELNRRLKMRFEELAIESPLTSYKALHQTPPTVIGVIDPR